MNFDKIMNIATHEALGKAAKRIADKDHCESSSGLDPNMKDILEVNKINIIMIEEMVKAGLKQYHKALGSEVKK